MIIQDTFRDRSRLHLMPFVSAGYPSMEATAQTLVEVSRSGASLIEVGIPFSDPIADGPVIQESFTEALAAGATLDGVLQTVKNVRSDVKVPLVAMVSFSVAFRVGTQKFTEKLKSAGFDGLILPDLPPPEAERFTRIVQAGGLDTCLLVAPTSSPARRKEIADLSSGFVYYLSVSGITGERAALPPDLAAGLADMRKITTKPLCVGFGLSKREHLDGLKGHADGAIVGSAVVRRMKAGGADPTAVARGAAQLCRELLE
jgi:tryptophan synthase alpha chain